MPHRVRHGRPAALAAAALLLSGCVEDPTTPAASESAQQLQARSYSSVALEETTGRHIVLFRAAAVYSGFEQDVASLGGRVEQTIDAIGVAIVDGLSNEAVSALSASAQVAGVEEDLIFPLEEPVGVDAFEEAEETPESHDPTRAGFYGRQWHLRAISADVAWAAGMLGSSDVLVSIVDSGLDYTHAALAGLVDLDRSISLHRWDDAMLADSFPGAHPIADMNRHGTHVGSTVVSTGQVGAGVTGHTTLMGVKVCGAVVGCPRSAVLQAIVYSADQGADIINMSLGGAFLKRSDRGFWLPLVLRATNYAQQKGSLVVVSAGNDAIDLDHDADGFKTYCSSTNVVCVSATGPTTRQSVNGPWNDFDQAAYFTNFGRSAIDVAAPGGNRNNFVYAACSSFSVRSRGCRASKRFIIGLRGTSMAAPHATGVAALIVAHSTGPGNPALIRNRLRETADQITEDGNDPYFGKGRINAARAVGLQ